MSHDFPASIFLVQPSHLPFLFKKRLSLNEVEKVGRRTDRIIVSSVSSADTLPFNVRLLLIVLILVRGGPGKVFQEIDFATGIELGERQSFSRTNGEATPAVRAERLLSNPACGVFS